jgi:Kef-type K+ transport system membrane component KefB
MSTTSRNILRALAEIGFIIFLFYTNLLMGQFTRAHTAQRAPGFLSAVYEVFTPANALIGLIGAIIGYLVIEGLRKYLNDS